MRAIAWGTLVATFCTSLYLIDRGSFDQDARNIAADSQLKARAVASSATAGDQNMRELNDLSKMLKESATK